MSDSSQTPQAPQPPQTPETAATPATWGTALWSNLLSAAVVVWFCARGLALALDARGRVAALAALPPWWLYGPTLVLAAAALVALAVARVRRLPPDRPPYKLLPVLAVLLLGVQIFAVPQAQLPLPADEIILAQAALLEPEAFTDEDGLFTTTAERLVSGLGPFEAPFLGRDGKPLGRWRPVVRTGCSGPETAVPAGMDAGALLYCVSADRTKAWMSFVGVEGLAGKPRIVKQDEQDPSTLVWDHPPKAPPAPPAPAEPSPAEPPNDQ